MPRDSILDCILNRLNAIKGVRDLQECNESCDLEPGQQPSPQLAALLKIELDLMHDAIELLDGEIKDLEGETKTVNAPLTTVA